MRLNKTEMQYNKGNEFFLSCNGVIYSFVVALLSIQIGKEGHCKDIPG